jgi:hypothetical protein
MYKFITYIVLSYWLLCASWQVQYKPHCRHSSNTCENQILFQLKPSESFLISHMINNACLSCDKRYHMYNAMTTIHFSSSHLRTCYWTLIIPIILAFPIHQLVFSHLHAPSMSLSTQLGSSKARIFRNSDISKMAAYEFLGFTNPTEGWTINFSQIRIPWWSYSW